VSPPTGPEPGAAPAAPPRLEPAAPAPLTGDVTGGLIPYKNPHALAAYYLGVFSVIPCVGFVLGCGAVPLGISGLRQRAKHPVIRGSLHAWVGIVLGSLAVLVHLAFAILLVAVRLRHR
jgi:hypothetical protein